MPPFITRLILELCVPKNSNLFMWMFAFANKKMKVGEIEREWGSERDRQCEPIKSFKHTKSYDGKFIKFDGMIAWNIASHSTLPCRYIYPQTIAHTHTCTYTHIQNTTSHPTKKNLKSQKTPLFIQSKINCERLLSFAKRMQLCF